MPAPLLSILIPTRNRVETAIDSVNQARSLKLEDTEIVVQDCGSDDRLGRLISESGEHGAVNYAHSSAPLSMTDNYNAAVSRAQGRYVVLVGDDDAVLPYLRTAAEWLSQREVNAMAYRWRASYFWSDFPDPVLAGKVGMQTLSGRLEWLDPESSLQNSLRWNGGKYHQELPKLYHGLVSMKALRALRDKSGTYFSSTIPDYYIAHALCSVVGRYALLDFPLTLPGACGKSNSARYRVTDNITHHLAEFDSVEWPERFPISHSVPATVAGAMLKALQLTGRTDLEDSFRLELLYANTILQDRTRVLQHFRRLRSVAGARANIATAKLAVLLAGKIAQRVRARVAAPFKRASGAWDSLMPAATLQEAVSITCAALDAGPRPQL